MKPLISIVIPYYKKKKYISQTINSIIKQSYKNFELILIYDDPDKSDLKYIKKIIKKIKRKLLRKTDWRINKIYRNKSYTNSHPKLELLNAMHDCKGIIHMGAHRGGEAAVYDWFNKQTIWIEANPKIIDDLKDHTSQYIYQRVIQALLSDEDNKLENFNISSNDGASSSIFSFGSYKKIHEKKND